MFNLKLFCLATVVALVFSAVCWAGITVMPSGAYMGLDKPEGIGNWIKWNITYTKDDFDHWQTPEETLKRRAGDCEDYAILAQKFLKDIDIRGEIVYFTLTIKGRYSAHAICVFKEADGLNYIGTERYQRVKGKTMQEVCNCSAKRAGAPIAEYIRVYTDKEVQEKIKETKNDTFYGCSAPVGNGWLTPDYIEQALKKEGLVIIEISTTWCGSCKRMEEAKQDPKNVELLKNFTNIWVDADKYPDLKQKYGARAYPTVILFKNGKEVNRMIGGTDARSLTIILNDWIRRFKNV